MANAWDNTQPTNATILKDNIPAELVALKQVNLDRSVLSTKGVQSRALLIQNTGGSYYLGYGPVPFVADRTTKGSYVAVAGEYTCAADGWYRANFNVSDIWTSFTASGGVTQLSLMLSLQRYTSGAWATVKSFYHPGNNSVSGSFVKSGSAVVQLTNGDKLRMYTEYFMLCTGGAPSSAIAGPPDNTYDSFEVEYLRP